MRADGTPTLGRPTIFPKSFFEKSFGGCVSLLYLAVVADFLVVGVDQALVEAETPV